MEDDERPLPTVAVVVPTVGRRPDELLASLRSVLADSATAEVVVAADVGPDEPLPAVSRDPRVRTVRVPVSADELHAGEGRARDWAVGCATAEVVLALDDDVVPEPGLVTGHASRHCSSVVVVGYMPVAHSGLPLRFRPAARYYSRSYELACRRFEHDRGAVLAGLWAGNLSVRRSDWPPGDGAGSGYHGDLALGLRLAGRGLVGTFDRSLRAEHRYRRTLRALAADQEASAAARLRLHAAYPDAVAAPVALSDRRPVAGRP